MGLSCKFSLKPIHWNLKMGHPFCVLGEITWVDFPRSPGNISFLWVADGFSSFLLGARPIWAIHGAPKSIFWGSPFNVHMRAPRDHSLGWADSTSLETVVKYRNQLLISPIWAMGALRVDSLPNMACCASRSPCVMVDCYWIPTRICSTQTGRPSRVVM